MELTSAELFELNRFIDLLGVFANAILGGVLARSERFDVVGFVVLAMASGLGGGMIRDALLQEGTAAALADSLYVMVAIAGALVAFYIKVEGRWWDRLYPIVDALALGCWAAVGSLKALSYGLGWLPAVLLGTITAVGGGVVRDMMLRRVPRIFGGNTLYATSAVASGVVMVIMFELGYPAIGLLVTTAFGAGMTLLAKRFGWILPESYAWRPKVGYPRPKLPARWRPERVPYRSRKAARPGESADG